MAEGQDNSEKLNIKLAGSRPEDLRNRTIDDKYLHSILVELTVNDKLYQAIHVARCRPSIRLIGPPSDENCFYIVENLIAGIAKGKPQISLREEFGRLSDYIELSSVTQAGVADLSESYEEFFGNAVIPVVYFYDIPESVVRNLSPARQPFQIFRGFVAHDIRSYGKS